MASHSKRGHPAAPLRTKSYAQLKSAALTVLRTYLEALQ